MIYRTPPCSTSHLRPLILQSRCIASLFADFVANIRFTHVLSLYLRKGRVYVMKVLLVDDSPFDLLILRKYFEGSLAEITAITDSKHAASLIQSRSFDLIVTDFDMLELNGLDLLHCARECTPRTPVWCVTGSLGERTLNEGSGFDEIFLKPLAYEQFLKALHRFSARNEI